MRFGSSDGRMSESSVEIGLASAQRRLPPPKSSACRLRQEGPGDRLVHSRARRARAPRGSAAAARRDAPARHRLQPRQRHMLDLVEPVDADDLLDEIGLAVDVRPPGRHLGDDRRRRLPATPKPSASQDARAAPPPGCRRRRASPRGRGGAERAASRTRRRAGDHRAPMPRRRRARGSCRVAISAPGLDEGRIDAALEAVARVGMDAELAPGRRGADRVEIRRLQEDVRSSPACSRVASPPMMPPMRLRPALVGDHGHRRVERVGLAVERLDASRPSRASRAWMPPSTLSASKTCSGRAIGIGDVVGDVDQRRDRPQADGAQPPLHPVRRGTVPHAADDSGRRTAGRARSSSSVEAELDADGARERALAPRAASIGFSVPTPFAARSRAMPWTPSASGRFGVTPTSMTGSSSPAQAA